MSAIQWNHKATDDIVKGNAAINIILILSIKDSSVITTPAYLMTILPNG